MRSFSAEKVRQGDLREIARAATAIENRRPETRDLLRGLFPHTGHAMLIGVTGAPGAGKSTLVNALTAALRAESLTVGILAVDATSPYSGGAILGDRIRMQNHHADEGVFIRSMATRGWLGGLARATTDLAVLLDAAGRDVILVETVGVGQDEVDVARLADVTVVVLVPGMGDDVQALKAGIMEIADVFVINKSDREGAAELVRELAQAQSLAHRPDGWTPPIVQTVASQDKGITETLAAVRSFHSSGLRRRQAAHLWSLRLREMLREQWMDRIDAAELQRAAEDVAARRKDPYTVVESWLEK